VFTNVLVGVEGGEGGRDALALARELHGAGGALTLAHVHGGYPIAGRASSIAYEQAERERAELILASERMAAKVEAKLSSIGQPSVGRGLHLLAEQHSADLLVVGSSRRGLLGRVLLGDDTRAALDGAPCPVAVAPAGYARAPHALREIGVGYDGSPEAERALAVARKLAAERSVRLSVCQVVELPPVLVSAVAEPLPEGGGEDLVAAVRARLEQLGGLEAHAVYGQASEELALYSASLSLLVLGSRSYGPLGRLVHGSTTRQLLRSGRCPLLVVERRLAGVDRL